MDPHDPVLTHRNTVVQNFVRLLSEAGVSLDVVEDVFRVFDEDSSGESVLGSWVTPCGTRSGIRRGGKSRRAPTQDPSTYVRDKDEY